MNGPLPHTKYFHPITKIYFGNFHCRCSQYGVYFNSGSLSSRDRWKHLFEMLFTCFMNIELFTNEYHQINAHHSNAVLRGKERGRPSLIAGCQVCYFLSFFIYFFVGQNHWFFFSQIFIFYVNFVAVLAKELSIFNPN